MDRELSAELMREYAEHSPRIGDLTKPTFIVEGGNPSCGDEVQLYVEMQGNVVKTARYKAKGCLINRASSGLMSEMVESKNISEVLALNIHNLEEGMGTQFSSRAKCALLPLFILQEGLKRHQAAPTEGAHYKITAPRHLGM